jgi:hypothetical protein
MCIDMPSSCSQVVIRGCACDSSSSPILSTHLPNFFNSSLHSVSPYPRTAPRLQPIIPNSPQLHRKVLIRVIVIPTLFPQMRIAVGNLCLLLSPVFDGEVLELVVFF